MRLFYHGVGHYSTTAIRTGMHIQSLLLVNHDLTTKLSHILAVLVLTNTSSVFDKLTLQKLFKNFQ